MWEWRAFAPSFPRLDGVHGHAPGERRVDLYVLGAPGLKLRDGRTLELKTLEETDGALERWRKPFLADLEVPPWRTRELARLLAPGAPVPVRPLRALDCVVRLVRDLRLGEARVLSVAKEIRDQELEPGVRFEATALQVDGRRCHTIALDGADLDAMRHAVARLAPYLPADARVASYPTWLASLPVAGGGEVASFPGWLAPQ